MINNLEQPYNWYNLEPNFRIFLSAVKKIQPVSIKNYLSDIRHFFGWAGSYQSANHQLDTLMSGHTLDSYRIYLISSKLPKRTVNRRLSSLRALCDFLLTQNIIQSDPSKLLRNYSGTPDTEREIKLSDQFKLDMNKQGLGENELINLNLDVEEFLQFVHKKQI